MKKVHKFSKLIAIALVLATMVSFVPSKNASADSAYLIKYIDKNFYGRSAPEPFNLQVNYDTLYVGARCEGDTPDSVTLHILNNSGECIFHHTFIADGHIEELSLSFPAQRIKIYMDGDPSIKKTDGCVAWGAHASIIQFVWPW